MAVDVSCDGCGKDIDDTYCGSCAIRKSGNVDASDRTEDDLIDLAAALRRGDISAAEDALDRVAGGIEGWREFVERGRYSRAAHSA